MFTWTQVPWVVTDVIVHEDDDDGDTYEPVVKYTCGWITTNQKQWYSSSAHYRVWENVKVFCDESNPTKFAIKSFWNYVMLLFPLVWLLVLFFWVKSLREDIRRKKLKNKLTQSWVHVEAIISEIKDTGARTNNIPWYKIIANWNWKVFTSETVYAALQYILKEWDKIDVYVDPINSDDYWMDTDSIFDRPIRDDYVPDNSNGLNNFKANNLLWSFMPNSGENILNGIVWDSTINNTTSVTPRPPVISDKKCPIRRIKNGYWVGIIFWLIWLWILISFLINTVNAIRAHWVDSGAIELSAVLFGGIFMIIWLVILIPKIRRDRKKKKLMEWWVKKEGMVTEISHNNTIINNQKWYIITAICDWKLYESTAVYADIYYLVEEGDEIDIYVGTWWDEDYRVDIDSLFYRELKSSYYDRPHWIGDVFNIIKGTIKK